MDAAKLTGHSSDCVFWCSRRRLFEKTSVWARYFCRRRSELAKHVNSAGSVSRVSQVSCSGVGWKCELSETNDHGWLTVCRVSEIVVVVEEGGSASVARQTSIYG